MDEQVVRALKRWPDVPAAFGWLRLDRRGRWYLVDRNQPGFDEARDGAGSLITSETIVDFINRNYQSDRAGRWYWQNGPQRAYADIEAAPLVLRVLTNNKLVAHTGELVDTVSDAWIGTDDALYLQTDLGPACVHDLDLSSLEIDTQSVQMLGQRMPLRTMTQAAPATLGFDARPRPEPEAGSR